MAQDMCFSLVAPFRFSSPFLPRGRPGRKRQKKAAEIDGLPTGGCPAPENFSFRPAGNDERGLTLLELLVVLVMVSLLGTLLIQGVGFFLGRYGTVSHVGRTSSLAVLQQHWFGSTVQGLVPSLRDHRRFRGGESSFEGVTLQPLATHSGRPTRVRWFIDVSGDGSSSVTYAEENGLEWRVLALPTSGLSFQYADANSRWYDRWPLAVRSRQAIPSMVRLVADTGRKVWVARPDLFPEPVANFRDSS